MALPAQSGQLVGAELYKPQRGQEAGISHVNVPTLLASAHRYPKLLTRDTALRPRQGREGWAAIPSQIINLNQHCRQAGRQGGGTCSVSLPGAVSGYSSTGHQ